MVGRHAGRAQQREILEVAGRLGHRPVDEIRHNNFAARFARHAEAQDERFARRWRGDRSPRGASSRMPGLKSHPPLGFSTASGGGREVAIRKALFEDGPGGLAMEIQAVGLTVELVPAQLEPLETFVNGIERGLRVPFDVRIIDAQNDDAAMVARIQPIEDESSSAANVKVTCGRGRKTDACHDSNLYR